MTHGFDDMVINGEKSSLSRMMFDIGRLERIEEVVKINSQQDVI